jgi:hypothetical protein
MAALNEVDSLARRRLLRRVKQALSLISPNIPFGINGWTWTEITRNASSPVVKAFWADTLLKLRVKESGLVIVAQRSEGDNILISTCAVRSLPL